MRHRHELPGTQTPAGHPEGDGREAMVIDDADTSEDQDADDQSVL
jgi:hypothetical protein